MIRNRYNYLTHHRERRTYLKQRHHNQNATSRKPFSKIGQTAIKKKQQKKKNNNKNFHQDIHAKTYNDRNRQTDRQTDFLFRRKLLQFLVYQHAHMTISYGHNIYMADNK